MPLEGLMLRVLSAGCIFYNFDPLGHGFVRHVISNVGIGLVIVSRSFLKSVEKVLSDYDKECLDPDSTSRLSTDIIFMKLRSVPTKSHDPDLAYCITTSGTTGVPKVVMVTHSCIVPNIQHLQKIYSAAEKDIIFMSSPLTFDPSIVEIFVTLTSGACLVMTSNRVKQSPAKLLEILVSNKVSIIQATPSLITRLSPRSLSLSILGPHSSLRVLALGGEDFPPLPVIRSWRSEQNTTMFINLYGITEVSCWAMYHVLSTEDLSIGDESVPLGQPLQDTEVKVRDHHGNPIISGIGELYIGGSKRFCQVDGIDGRNDDTDKLYPTGDIVEVTEDSRILYRGRKDSQVKRNGMRINLQQIDRVLMESGLVSWGKAVFHNNKLFLFYQNDEVTKSRHILDDFVDVKQDFRCSIVTLIRETLPSHYWPDVVKILDVIPITNHGKVEGLYHKHLQIDKISDDTNFLEVGGNSMLAVQVLSEIERLLNQQVPELLEIILDKSVKDVGDTVQKLLITQTTMNNPNIEHENHHSEKSDRAGITEDTSKYEEHKGINDKYEVLTSRSLPNETSHAKKRKLDIQEISNKNDSRKMNLGAHQNIMSYGLCSIRRGNQFQLINEKVIHNRMDRSSMKECQRCTCKITVDNTQETHSVYSPQLKELWRYDTGKCVDASPLIVKLSDGQAAVYMGSHSHRFCAVSMETGGLLWETTLGDRVESSASLSACGRYVIVVLYLQSKLCIWRRELGGGSIFSSPCISTSPHVIVACSLNGRIVSINPTYGEILWQYSTEKPVFSSPVYTPVGPCVGCVDGHIYQLNHTGKLVWKFSTSGPIFSSPTMFWLHNDSNGVNRESGQMSVDHYVMLPGNTDNSKQVLVEDTKYRTHSSCDYRILIGSHDHHVYCLSHDGSLLWKLKLNSFVYSTPFGFTSTFMKGEEHKPLNKSSINSKCCQEDNVVDQAQDLSVIHKAGEEECHKISLCSDCSRVCDTCVLTSSTGSLHLVNTASGDLECCYTLPGEVFSSPVVYGDRIVVGCRDNFIYCLQYEKVKDL
ncbi:hypothetical protein FSP39_016338 [Pinctada imbricata]|uniref:Carrier domain-containing protein n=1 Tax=Pinctada imbricata TaxID=66713 RepID=A0AA88YIT0_PINIB|nr:hypothetical protein FSP39_016338 [Pinctada imbricata]